jgi:phage-related protein
MVLFAADSKKKLLVLHSFKNAGGTLLRPEKKLMCLSGSTGEIATVFEVKQLTLVVECNLVTPTIDALREL